MADGKSRHVGDARLHGPHRPVGGAAPRAPGVAGRARLADVRALEMAISLELAGARGGRLPAAISASHSAADMKPSMRMSGGSVDTKLAPGVRSTTPSISCRSSSACATAAPCSAENREPAGATDSISADTRSTVSCTSGASSASRPHSSAPSAARAATPAAAAAAAGSPAARLRAAPALPFVAAAACACCFLLRCRGGMAGAHRLAPRPAGSHLPGTAGNARKAAPQGQPSQAARRPGRQCQRAVEISELARSRAIPPSHTGPGRGRIRFWYSYSRTRVSLRGHAFRYKSPSRASLLGGHCLLVGYYTTPLVNTAEVHCVSAARADGSARPARRSRPPPRAAPAGRPRPAPPPRRPRSSRRRRARRSSPPSSSGPPPSC